MLFMVMVQNVDPIIYLHETTKKEKVLLPPPRNNCDSECEETVTSTQSSLQVQHASVACVRSRWVKSIDFVIYTFSPAKLSSERGEKEVLADSKQPIRHRRPRSRT